MFIGRKEYLDSLEMLWNKSTASLVTCRGRRRIGKSTLIEEFAARTAEIEGLPPCKGMTDRRQRRHFCQVLSDQTGCRRVAPQSWTAAFKMLDEAVSNQGRTVILLDEISWMGSRNPDFAGFLKGAWDKFCRQHPELDGFRRTEFARRRGVRAVAARMRVLLGCRRRTPLDVGEARLPCGDGGCSAVCRGNPARIFRRREHQPDVLFA